MTKILVTGGAGFIGHHFVSYLLRHTDFEITILDRLDFSGNLNRLVEIGANDNPRVRFVYHDLKAPVSLQVGHQIGPQDYIVHLAAATHVDRSIEDPMSFVMDNVVGTCNLMNFALSAKPRSFIYFSTDEVFGPASPGDSFKENDRYRSGNPYAATKAGGEELALAFHNTYGLPVVITHTMNVLGTRQSPEKFLPLVVSKVLAGETVTIHSDRTKTIPGVRSYIDAEDVASALVLLLQQGVYGQKYNIVGNREMNNLELAQTVAQAINKPLKFEMVDFHSSRPGHDMRYALDGNKMKTQLGFFPAPPDIGRLAKWYVDHQRSWLMSNVTRSAA